MSVPYIDLTEFKTSKREASEEMRRLEAQCPDESVILRMFYVRQIADLHERFGQLATFRGGEAERIETLRNGILDAANEVVTGTNRREVFQVRDALVTQKCQVNGSVSLRDIPTGNSPTSVADHQSPPCPNMAIWFKKLKVDRGGLTNYQIASRGRTHGRQNMSTDATPPDYKTLQSIDTGNRITDSTRDKIANFFNINLANIPLD